MGRTILKVLVALAVVAAIALGALWLGFWWVLRPSPASLPPLAEGLPAKFADANRMFGERVAAAFPVGSTEADLVRMLGAQGFVLVDVDDGSRLARFEQQKFPCRLMWSVTWKADDAARLSQVEGHHQGVCL